MSATPSAQYRLTIRVRIEDEQGTLGLLTAAISEAGGIVAAVDLVEVDGPRSVRDIVVDASGREHWGRILGAIEAVPGGTGNPGKRPRGTRLIPGDPSRVAPNRLENF